MLTCAMPDKTRMLFLWQDVKKHIVVECLLMKQGVLDIAKLITPTY